MATLNRKQQTARPPRAHAQEGRRHPGASRVSRSISPARTSTPRSSTTRRARPSPPRTPPRSDFKGDKKTRANKDTAEKIGKLVAERAKAKNITKVVFDRGGFIYHGKVKALADAAREGGLEF